MTSNGVSYQNDVNIIGDVVMKKLTQAELRRVLCYNPLSGNFMWRISPRPNIKKGSIAGSISGPKRSLYIHIFIHGYAYKAHRLAFLYIRGCWPRDQVDHKDKDGLNNRWLNLREATQSQNKANSGPHKNNKLGIKGVHRRTNGKYRVKISVRGKRYYLGQYETLEAAARAYRNAARKHFKEFASW